MLDFNYLKKRDLELAELLSKSSEVDFKNMPATRDETIIQLLANNRIEDARDIRYHFLVLLIRNFLHEILKVLEDCKDLDQKIEIKKMFRVWKTFLMIKADETYQHFKT